MNPIGIIKTSIMSWLSQLLSRKKVQNCEPTATPPESPSPPPESMAQVVVEETVMAVAKWLINLVNRTWETQATSPKPEANPSATPAEEQAANVDTPVETDQASAVDQLLTKFSGLIEEACDRTQAIALLESRLQELEASMPGPPDWQDSIQVLNQAVIKLDRRLSQVEKMLQQVDLGTVSQALAASLEHESHLQQWAQTSTQQIAEVNGRLNTIQTAAKTAEEQHRATLHKIFKVIQPTVQQTTALDKRVSHLEKVVILNPAWLPPIPLGECHKASGLAMPTPLRFGLLGIGVMRLGFGITRLSLVPKFAENNCRSITTLQNHIKQAQGSPVLNGNGSQKSARRHDGEDGNYLRSL